MTRPHSRTIVGYVILALLTVVTCLASAYLLEEKERNGVDMPESFLRFAHSGTAIGADLTAVGTLESGRPVVRVDFSSVSTETLSQGSTYLVHVPGDVGGVAVESIPFDDAFPDGPTAYIAYEYCDAVGSCETARLHVPGSTFSDVFAGTFGISAAAIGDTVASDFASRGAVFVTTGPGGLLLQPDRLYAIIPLQPTATIGILPGPYCAPLPVSGQPRVSGVIQLNPDCELEFVPPIGYDSYGWTLNTEVEPPTLTAGYDLVQYVFTSGTLDCNGSNLFQLSWKAEFCYGYPEVLTLVGTGESASDQSSVANRCGDGILQSPEECDEGSSTNGTSTTCCGSDCQVMETGTVCHVGNGECDPEETCDGQSGACPEQNTDGAMCNDADGNSCTTGECDGRTCQPIPMIAHTCPGGYCVGPESPEGIYCFAMPF